MSEPGALLHPFAPPSRTSFLNIVRGEGAGVFDDAGKRYVDAIASLWFCNIGHGRREMADAIAAQVQQLASFHTFDRFTTPAADELARRLAALAPMSGARVFLVGSGSEAVDSALKLARLAHVRAGRPERTIVVSRSRAYHGVTYGGVSAQGLPLNQAGFGPLLPDVVNVDADDLDALGALFTEHGDRIAAVIAEPVMGAGGVHPPADGYLRGLRTLCDTHGAYLILDEVICGFGRLGEWWGATRYGVEPDLVTFAKAVTSGYIPLGGVLVGTAVREPLEADDHFVLRHGHTYSGHAAACVAAMTAIDITQREGLLDRVSHIEKTLGGGLASLVEDGSLAGVRGVGGVWAAVMQPGTSAVTVRDRMLGLGVIARPLGDEAIAFCPPLVIGDDDLGRCLEALTEALQV